MRTHNTHVPQPVGRPSARRETPDRRRWEGLRENSFAVGHVSFVTDFFCLLVLTARLGTHYNY